MATATETPASTAAAEPDSLYEIIDGRIQEKPPMGAFEVVVASWLHEFLAPYVRAHGLGWSVCELLFRVDGERGLSRRPDLAFLSFERWPKERQPPCEAAWEAVPDLAVEVISPSNSATDVQDMIRDYFRAGVRVVWIIFPRSKLVYVYESVESIRVLSAEKGDNLDGGAVVPGFTLSLKTLFGEEAT
jgi:Uma2 family endonuclease